MRIVQLLNWDLNSIKSILPNIKTQGFDAIQINPMQPFKEEKNFNWWSSYQPLGFRIGNCFGSKEDLKELCRMANNLDLAIIVDVICNHMANKSGEECLVPHENVDKELLEQKNFWKPQIMLQNGDNRYEATHHLIGLPGLDLSQTDLQKIIFRYLQELADCGVKGFRFDAAKHIGLANDGVDFFNNVQQFLVNNNLFAYGEFLSGDTPWQTEFTNYIPILNHYSSKLEDYSKLFTFIESHDTYLNQCWNSTRSIKTADLCLLQTLLNQIFPNTLFYVRPNKFPYDPFSGISNYGNMKPLDCFELDFLENENLKRANEYGVEYPQKTKKIGGRY